MANRIKGITVEIGGDTTGLSKALKGVNSEIRNTQSQLKDVEKMLKLNPTNTELLKQKQSLLAEAVGETKQKLEQLKDAEKQVQEQFKRGEISQQQYDGLKREIMETEMQLKDLEKQAAQSNATLSKIGAVAGKVSEGAAKVSDATKGMSRVAGAGIVAIGGMAYKAAQSADDLNTLAKQTGISTETLQKMQYATDLIDVEFDTFTGSMSKMIGKLKTGEETFNEYGIATRGAGDEMLSNEDIYKNAIKSLSEIQNETERDIAAQKIFGKSASELAGLIDDGGAAFEEYGKQAEELGLILDQGTLDSLNEVNDEIDQIKADAIATFAKSGAEALEALSPVLDDVRDAIGDVLDKIGDLEPNQIETILKILGAVALISPVAGIISKISGAISAITPVISGLFGIIAQNPIILVIAAIIAAIALLVKNWDTVSAWFKGKFDELKETITAFKDGAVNAWQEFTDKINEVKENVVEKFETIKEKIVTPIQEAKDKVKGFVDEIQEFFANMKAKLPDIKLPHFSVSYSVPTTAVGKAIWQKALGLEGKPSLSVSWYKKAMNNAMLLNQPTIFGAMNGKLLGAGEAGSEVVAGSNTLMNMIRSAVNNGNGNAMLAELQSLNSNIRNLKIVLDSGTVVGELSDGFNKSLGDAYYSEQRRALA